MIYNVFDEDLLTWYREPWFKRQYIESAPIPDIINKEEEEDKVEEIRNHRKQECGIQFLVHCKEYGNEYN